MSDVAEELTRALRDGGFDRWSFLAAPNGFALVTRLEQISSDGTPQPVPARWSADMPRVDDMNLWAFVKALFNAHPGFYRVIVFVVTDRPWQRDQDAASRAEARGWLREGFDVLPRDFGSFPYSSTHRTKALVYEFKKDSKNEEAEYLKASETDADEHLEKAGIARPLSR